MLRPRILPIESLSGKLRRAFLVAEAECKRANGRFRHGACLIVSRNVSAGHNRLRPIAWASVDRRKAAVERGEAWNARLCAHAEIMALHAARKARNAPLSRALVVVLRLDTEGRYAYSRPCAMCAHNLERVGVTRIYYTDGKGGLCAF